MNLCSVIGKKTLKCYAFMIMWREESFFHFDSPEISQANLIVWLLLLTKGGRSMKRIRQEGRRGRGGGSLWMWKLYLHTRMNNQQLWKKNAEKSTHTHFLHFCTHNGSLKESTNLVILLHRGFVMPAKRQYFEWCDAFSSLCLVLMRLSWWGIFFL